MKETIKYIFLILLLVFVSLRIKIAGCQVPERAGNERTPAVYQESALPKNAFPDGERIKFGVYSTAIKVGSGELYYKGVSAVDGKKAQEIAFKVATFSVTDEDKIFGTLDFGSPLKVERKVRVFGRDEVISEVYASDRRSVTISKSVDGKAPETLEIKTAYELNNVLLLLYNLRNDQGLKVGKSYKITLPTQNFELFVKDIRRLKTPLGTFKAFYLESKPAKYRIWLSPEPGRLPLRIQGLVAGGMLYLVATEVSK
ncbi:MAG TPA: hypothetical protein DCL35_02250 [Candidatus Omnitrophica bacterium]|nr:hypothetical protein [Candidatus Omnitrophota bacterium]